VARLSKSRSAERPGRVADHGRAAPDDDHGHTAGELQLDQSEDRYQVPDVERGSGGVEAVVALDRRSSREPFGEAAAVLMQHASPAQFIEQSGQTGGTP